MPTNVTAIQGGTEDDIDFSIYLSIPNLPPIENIPGIPLAIIFHAFNNPDRSSYTDWIDHLVGRGAAVAFIQYPTDVRPDGGDDFDATTTNGTSDWPHHVPRLYSIQSALNKLAYVIDDATRETISINCLAIYQSCLNISTLVDIVWWSLLTQCIRDGSTIGVG